MLLFTMAWACACLFSPIFITPTSPSFSGLAWAPQHVWGFVFLLLFLGQLSPVRRYRWFTLAVLFILWLIVSIGVTRAQGVVTGTFIYAAMALMTLDIMAGGAE